MSALLEALIEARGEVEFFDSYFLGVLSVSLEELPGGVEAWTSALDSTRKALTR